MDLKEQIIQEYLQQGCGYRKLQDKYGISRNAIRTGKIPAQLTLLPVFFSQHLRPYAAIYYFKLIALYHCAVTLRPTIRFT
jgi:transposase-like protein